MDLTDLLTSRGDDEPSGENLEYDPAFISLELAAQHGEERQVGDSVIAAEEPDHAEVISNAMEVLERSHDLRAAVFLAYSLLRTKGFPGFAQATTYIRGCLEQWWDSCHPQLDPDDDNDPTMRVNAIAALADADTMMRGIRLAPLTDSRAFGRVCLRDFMLAEGEISLGEDGESPPDLSALSAAFQDTDPARLQELRDAARQAQEDIKAIGRVFDEQVPTFGPDLAPLEKILRQVMSRFEAAGIGAAGGEEPEGVDGDEGQDAGADGAIAAPRTMAAPAGAGVPGVINSQQDVRNALDKIIAYYKRAEPSSPLPILLDRAKRLVGADFMTIIKDMAPDGRSNVQLIGGLEDEEEY
ncbi:type VI secretion system protein TssA [Szabonella alba]|uniref:Type VI secretion system protein TssA n=1 Tax=Szabonella alba TaxID=2804194 RepID=A0A8K0VH80_9RHOB|nr:type VI secretion system protein TssA [Szabonella alba]MBL4919060.1 type VI secretion system protein TssA [Szabonella alba]